METPLNVYANSASRGASGLALFERWILPGLVSQFLFWAVSICSGMNCGCKSYDDFGDEIVAQTLTAEQKNKQKVVGTAFVVFVLRWC